MFLLKRLRKLPPLGDYLLFHRYECLQLWRSRKASQEILQRGNLSLTLIFFLLRSTSYSPPTRQANKHKSRGQNRSDSTFAILVTTFKATLNWLLRFSAVNFISLKRDFTFLGWKVFAEQKVLISGQPYDVTHCVTMKIHSLCISGEKNYVFIRVHMKQMQLIEGMWM